MILVGERAATVGERARTHWIREFAAYNLEVQTKSLCEKVFQIAFSREIYLKPI